MHVILRHDYHTTRTGDRLGCGIWAVKCAIVGGMEDERTQLSLLATGAEVPQANNVGLLVRLMEAVDDGVRQVDELAEALDVEPRTVRYYAGLARWLGFLRQTGRARWAPTDTGAAFADSVSARGRLFSQGLFAKEVVQLANQIKRQAIDNGRALTTLAACRQAVSRTTELAEATAARRASSLASLLETAYRPSRIDWESGQVIEQRGWLALAFEGESFLTALAMRELGVDHAMLIGFPMQVHQFVCGQAHRLEPKRWRRASWKGADGSQWFGSVPVNDITREVALRKGRDLRQLLVITAPYVTLACALLALRDPLDRPLVRITRDMYGAHLWFHEVDLGGPVEALGRCAEALDLELRGRPPHLAQDDEPLADPADDDHLVEVLVDSGICRTRDTVVELAPGVRHEWRDGSEDAPSIAERLAPLRDRLGEHLRRSSPS